LSRNHGGEPKEDVSSEFGKHFGYCGRCGVRVKTRGWENVGYMQLAGGEWVRQLFLNLVCFDGWSAAPTGGRIRLLRRDQIKNNGQSSGASLLQLRLISQRSRNLKRRPHRLIGCQGVNRVTLA
jgi:hypothetical protein